MLCGFGTEVDRAGLEDGFGRSGKVEGDRPGSVCKVGRAWMLVRLFVLVLVLVLVLIQAQQT